MRMGLSLKYSFVQTSFSYQTAQLDAIKTSYHIADYPKFTALLKPDRIILDGYGSDSGQNVPAMASHGLRLRISVCNCYQRTDKEYQ